MTVELMGALDRGTRAAAGLTDARGYRRAPATTSEFHRGRTPRNKGRLFPPDPPTVEEIVALLEACPATLAGQRLRGLVIVLWRAGLRVSEALALTEHDLDEREHAVTVRRGKGGKRRVCGMDEWAWTHLGPWLEMRRTLPVGELFCVVTGPTAGRAMMDSDVRHALHKLGRSAGVRRRVAPHQFRHAHAVELARDGIGLHIVSRQLGHANLAITSTYMQGIAPTEVIDAVARRSAPMVMALGGVR